MLDIDKDKCITLLEFKSKIQSAFPLYLICSNELEDLFNSFASNANSSGEKCANFQDLTKWVI